MNKYKVVGLIDLVMGIIFIGYAVYVIYLLALVIPQMQKLYSELNIPTPPNPISTYLIFGLILFMSIGNLFLGIKLLKNSEPKEKYFKFGVIFVALNCISLVLFLIGIAASAILPIYTLITEIQ